MEGTGGGAVVLVVDSDRFTPPACDLYERRGRRVLGPEGRCWATSWAASSSFFVRFHIIVIHLFCFLYFSCCYLNSENGQGGTRVVFDKTW